MVRASRRRSATFALIAALLIPILPSALVASAAAASPDVVISQVYGGGGNSGATFTHDFVELYNRGSEPVSVDGFSVQYASATGTGSFGANSGQLTELPDVTLAPGQYLLIQEASNAAVGSPLPAPEVTDATPISMAAGAGKVALVTGDAGLGCNGSSTPCSADQLARIVDLVGYGNANFFEGTGAAPTLSATLAAFRDDGGATDTDDNAADFTAGTPNPRTSAPDEDDAPTVASTTPADGATNVPVTTSTISVTFSEEVELAADAITLDCAPEDTPVGVVDTSNPGTTFTMELIADLPDGATCSVTVDADKVADTDADDPPDTMAEDYVFEFSTESEDACAAAFTHIYDIQGSSTAAAITGNVTTQGVVVGDFQGTTGLSGFYLQDATGDDDATTSDGIFVYTGNENSVDEGDLVRVTATARERFNQTALTGGANNTPVPAANIVPCGTGTVDPTDVELPFASPTAPERYEGMLVRLSQDLVISEYFNYERFGELVLALPLDGETRPFTPTLLEEPGPDAQARALANVLSRITLDDGLSVQNPATVRHPNGDPFSLDNRFRGGDIVTNTVGVMGYDFDLYRIQPTAPAEHTSVNPRPEAPADVGGRLKVAAMNTLNFFITGDPLDDGTGNNDNPADNICGPQPPNHDCRGWDVSQPAEFDRQRDKLIAALADLDADVIGLNELENTVDVDPLGDPELGIAAGLNDVFGAGTYASIDTGVIGTDAIRVGLIYRPAAVMPVGDFAVLDSTVDPRFDTSFNRPALAQTFEEKATGARFTVVVNHLKSKGSDCNAVGDPDIGDGQGNCNLTRLAAAEALVDWIATDPTDSGDRDYLIVGDLNSYAMEDPIDAILAGADDEADTIDDFTNLVAEFGGPYAYSYVFDGQAGYLDHALSSATLTPQVTGVTEWHINADEPDLLDYDTSFKPPAQEAIYEPNVYRASDHDPVVVGLDLLDFGFEGYLAPVANPPSVNSVNAGSTVPIRFRLDGTTASDVLFATPTITRISCTTGAELGDPVAATGLGGLAVDASIGEYKIEWKTPKLLAGTCQRFELTLDDGTYRTALFHFR